MVNMVDFDEVPPEILEEARDNIARDWPMSDDLYHLCFDHPMIFFNAALICHLFAETVAFVYARPITEKLISMQNPSKLEMIAWIGYAVITPLILGGITSLYQKKEGRIYANYRQLRHQDFEAEIKRLIEEENEAA